MASLGQRFDATQYDTEQKDFENLPNGDYVLEVSASEVKATKNGEGLGASLTYTVIEPEQFKDRKFFSWINLQHKTAIAQEIGQKEFASLCRACGKSAVEDTEELHFQAFTAKVGTGKPSTKDGTTYPGRNEIKKFYFPDEGNVPAAKAEPLEAANDNRAAANDNTGSARTTQNGGTQPAAKVAGARPWGAKK